VLGFDIWAEEVQHISGLVEVDTDNGHSPLGARVPDRQEAAPGFEDDLPF
jgi:hypothetical protein